jgi:hypothetical protein
MTKRDKDKSTSAFQGEYQETRLMELKPLLATNSYDSAYPARVSYWRPVIHSTSAVPVPFRPQLTVISSLTSQDPGRNGSPESNDIGTTTAS